MKDRKIIGKTMHFLVHNGFIFTVMIMCLVHLTLFFIMCAGAVMPLIYFNILSVAVYLACVLLCRYGHIMPAYVCILLEVTAYTITSVHYLGLNSGSCCFLWSIVPIIIYFGSYLFKGHKRWTIVLILLLNFLTYVLLYIRYADAQPVYALAQPVEGILTIFSSFVMVFSMIFYNTIYIYASEYERVSLEQENQQLSLDAYEDTLTGLLNRRGFLPVIEAYMKEAPSADFGIAFCDLDDFKRINDTYGHDCGDEVLRHITRLFKKELHGCDICRWGGEEILVFLKDYEPEAAKEKMEEMRKSIESNPTVFFNRRIDATITIGLEVNKEIYHEPEEIIRVADERMYYGKQHGKNMLVCEDADQ